jgi:hypothetical protein
MTGVQCPEYPTGCTQTTGGCQNVCQGYVVTGNDETEVTFDHNHVDYCKFGLEVSGSATVLATENLLQFNYIDAVRLEGNAKLKAEGNVLKNNGCFTGSSSDGDVRGAVVIDTSSPEANGDFGGGSCVSFEGECSPSEGGNAFCQDGGKSTTDIYVKDQGQVSAGDNCWTNGTPENVSVEPIPTAPVSSCTQAAGFSPCP